MIQVPAVCGRRQNAAETPLRGVERNERARPTSLPQLEVGARRITDQPRKGATCTRPYNVRVHRGYGDCAKSAQLPLPRVARQGSVGTMTPAPDPTDANAPR